MCLSVYNNTRETSGNENTALDTSSDKEDAYTESVTNLSGLQPMEELVVVVLMDCGYTG